MSGLANRPGFSPFLAQRRADLLWQGAAEDSPEVQRLNARLVEHDAACALLRAEVDAALAAKWAEEDADIAGLAEVIEKGEQT